MPPGAEVQLGDVAPGTWSQLFVFGPYTAHHELERCIGRRVPERLNRGISVAPRPDVAAARSQGHVGTHFPCAPLAAHG